MKGQFWRTKNIALMGIFGTLSAVLMLFEVPLLFIAPSFYKLDFSQIPNKIFREQENRQECKQGGQFRLFLRFRHRNTLHPLRSFGGVPPCPS